MLVRRNTTTYDRNSSSWNLRSKSDVFSSLVTREVQPVSDSAPKNSTVALLFFNSSPYLSITDLIGSRAIRSTFSPSTSFVSVFKLSVKLAPSEESEENSAWGPLFLSLVLLRPLASRKRSLPFFSTLSRSQL